MYTVNMSKMVTVPGSHLVTASPAHASRTIPNCNHHYFKLPKNAVMATIIDKFHYIVVWVNRQAFKQVSIYLKVEELWVEGELSRRWVSTHCCFGS